VSPKKKKEKEKDYFKRFATRATKNKAVALG
jgi:hypothetical protein